MGDLPDKRQDPMEAFFDISRQGVYLSRQRFIVTPDWQPAQIPGMQAAQELIDEHAIPRLWQVLADFFLMVQRGTFFVKNPSWHEAPIIAENAEIRNEAAVALPIGSVDTVVATFTVPDRFIGSILSIGHALGNPLFWGLVTWNIRVNGRPVSSFQNFVNQLGTLVFPTKLSSPIRLKPFDLVEVWASNAGLVPVNAYARLGMFMYPATELTSDGSYAEYKQV
jgi:hypothetical protein